jgi:hypothetical protein
VATTPKSAREAIPNQTGSAGNPRPIFEDWELGPKNPVTGERDTTLYAIPITLPGQLDHSVWDAPFDAIRSRPVQHQVSSVVEERRQGQS